MIPETVELRAGREGGAGSLGKAGSKPPAPSSSPVLPLPRPTVTDSMVTFPVACFCRAVVLTLLHIQLNQGVFLKGSDVRRYPGPIKSELCDGT